MKMFFMQNEGLDYGGFVFFCICYYFNMNTADEIEFKIGSIQRQQNHTRLHSIYILFPSSPTDDTRINHGL